MRSHCLLILLLLTSALFAAESQTTRPGDNGPLAAMKVFRDAVAAQDRARVLALMVDPDSDIRQKRLAYFLDPARQAANDVQPAEELIDGDIAIVFNKQTIKQTGHVVFVMVPMVKINNQWLLDFELSDKAPVPAEQRERLRALMHEKGSARSTELREQAKAATQPADHP